MSYISSVYVRMAIPVNIPVTSLLPTHSAYITRDLSEHSPSSHGKQPRSDKVSTLPTIPCHVPNTANENHHHHHNRSHYLSDHNNVSLTVTSPRPPRHLGSPSPNHRSKHYTPTRYPRTCQGESLKCQCPRCMNFIFILVPCLCSHSIHAE